MRPGSHMTVIFVSATPYLDAIARPSCSECGAETLLVGIESERPNCDLYTFQCPSCEDFDTKVGKLV
jgi:hypothetical protein